jgi:BlaI family penicillinase repressor
MASIHLGRVQLQIMQILWNRRSATAREITDAMQPLGVAHSTVQTLLRGLEDKGVVAHDLHERTFVFRPLVSADAITRSATRDLIERVFGGSVSGLLAHLLTEESISARELSELKQLIDRHDRKSGRTS